MGAHYQSSDVMMFQIGYSHYSSSAQLCYLIVDQHVAFMVIISKGRATSNYLYIFFRVIPDRCIIFPSMQRSL